MYATYHSRPPGSIDQAILRPSEFSEKAETMPKGGNWLEVWRWPQPEAQGDHPCAPKKNMNARNTALIVPIGEVCIHAG